MHDYITFPQSQRLKQRTEKLMKEKYSYYYSKLPRFQDALEVDSEKEGLTKVCITYWFHERKKERKGAIDMSKKSRIFGFRSKFNSCLWNVGLEKLSKNFATSQNSRNFLIHLPLNSLFSKKKVAKPFHLTQRSILNSSRNFVQMNRA